MVNIDPASQMETAAIAARFLSRLAEDSADPDTYSPDSSDDSPGSSQLGEKPVQAQLIIQGADSPVLLDVNPHDVTIDKTQNTHASRVNRQSASDNSGSGGITQTIVGQTQYKGSTPGTLTIAGAVLGSEDGSKDISSEISTLYGALVPPSGDESTSTPPTVKFKWGTWLPLPNAYLSHLKVKVTDWKNDGTPVRAEIPTLILTETPAGDAGQNPTSGAFGSRRTRTVIAGDSLASIAYQEYGRPDYWRAIADVNGIDDPLRLRTGTELLIPPREFAKGKK
jgi:hypothetical protein